MPRIITLTADTLFELHDAAARLVKYGWEFKSDPCFYNGKWSAVLVLNPKGGKEED